MKILTKDQILEASDLKNEAVEVPEWGGSVLVRTMTGADRDAFEASLTTTLPDGARKPNMANMRAKLVALAVVGEDGNRLFEVNDVDRLALKSAAALERVFAAAQRINGLGAQAEEDAAKNSKAGLSEGSTSA
ncbi:hypothetical protein [Polaromonas jejuensis]|uniref:Phage tail assembly chaperone n=1 Tax=Polaromonas jejuensis TaxID=457502 RepID=A0ABW0QGE9_9BURK|nr:hypothetical protein [Polaromonas jejuensis]